MIYKAPGPGAEVPPPQRRGADTERGLEEGERRHEVTPSTGTSHRPLGHEWAWGAHRPGYTARWEATPSPSLASNAVPLRAGSDPLWS